MKILSALMLCIWVSTSVAQNVDKRSNTMVLESKILDESREILIQLPTSYSTEKHYPVCYILDAESAFNYHQSVLHYLAEQEVIPEMILVGIVNTNRHLNFTPSIDTASTMGPTGGAQQFCEFLTRELIPKIDATYATAHYRTLTGHSMGGLFAAYAMLHHPNAFDAYILMDPALWWDGMALVRNSAERISGGNFDKKKMFLGIANSMPAGMTDTSLAKADTTNSTVGIRSVFGFRDALGQSAKTPLAWSSRYYADESHGSVPLMSLYDGMKFIFSFYKRPSFQQLSDASPGILENHYQKVSEKLGNTILPPAAILSGLAWRCQVLDKKYDLAFAFLESYARLYPEDPIVYIQLAQYYSEIGQQENAQENYQKGIELGYTPEEHNNN